METLRTQYSHDKSSHAITTTPPVAAVVAESHVALARAVKVLNRHGVTMTVRGAGTGLEGGCIPYKGGVVLSTRRFQQIELDEKNGVCWVGAGVTKLQLDQFLSKHGLLFGPDPASNPSLGSYHSLHLYLSPSLSSFPLTLLSPLSHHPPTQGVWQAQAPQVPRPFATALCERTFGRAAS